jgi:acetyl-CoA synthetase
VSATERFKAARDFLLANRTDYDVAYNGFQWPKLDRFNWALDWFDNIAAGERCDQPAIWVVFEDGTETKLSFHQLSTRSSKIANYYRELGIRRGDHVMIMLGNVLPLWETVLALIKMGAVILPATPLLSRVYLADRIERRRVRHIVCTAECVPKVDHLGKHCTRVVVDGSVPGWHAYEDGYGSSEEFKVDGETRASDPMQLYFTSGTTAKAFIILQSGVTPSREIAFSIFQHIRKVLAPFNRIRRIEFSDLPKTISGKIRRVESRQRETANVQRGGRPELEFSEEDFPELE